MKKLFLIFLSLTIGCVTQAISENFEQFITALQNGNVASALFCAIRAREDETINEKDDDSHDFLWHALSNFIADSNLFIVYSLITSGANVFTKYRHGNTLMHLAATLDYPQLVDFLVSKGLDVNARNDAEQTPLHYSAAYHKRTIELRLLKHRATPINFSQRFLLLKLKLSKLKTLPIRIYQNYF